MPYSGETITYTANPSPGGASTPISYGWSLPLGGGTIVGSSSNSTVNVLWSTTGNFSVSVTTSNDCSSVSDTLPVEVTVPCTPPVINSSTGVSWSAIQVQTVGPNTGRRVMELTNIYNADVDLELNLNGNILSITIPANTPLASLEFVLPTVWVYTLGDVGTVIVNFSSDPTTCYNSGSATVV